MNYLFSHHFRIRSARRGVPAARLFGCSPFEEDLAGIAFVSSQRRRIAGRSAASCNVSGHGIDMEIEFKGDAKSNRAILPARRAEVFTIKGERDVRYWIAQAFP